MLDKVRAVEIVRWLTARVQVEPQYMETLGERAFIDLPRRCYRPRLRFHVAVRSPCPKHNHATG